jgi:hypothetical protein
MRVTISSKAVITFCKKYPDFSIEKLLEDYVNSVDRLGILDSESILPFVKEAVLEGIGESFTKSREMVMDELVQVTKRVQCDATAASLENILSKIPDRDAIVSHIRNVPNESVINQLSNISEKLSPLKDLNANFTDYTMSFKTGSIKGRNTEIKCAMTLDNIFPKHDITHVPSSLQVGKMDIILSLEGYPNISIDTKNYTKAVPKREVEKFENDMLVGKTHGILLSTTSKITSKPNFTIDVIGSSNNLVAVYLSNTGGDFEESIKLAVDVVYNLSKHLNTKECTGKSIDTKTVQMISEMLQKDIARLGEIKGHLTSSLECIKSMTLEKISSYF